jgi:chromosome partitioning protein
VNPKGGVGKTTTVFSLAAAFAALSRRVLAVDLDAQANLTASFGYDPDVLEVTVTDLLAEAPLRAEDVVLDTGVPGVRLVPADVRLHRHDGPASDDPGRERLLARRLEPLFRRADVVLFDGPPRLSRLTIQALLASDEVVVPVETQAYSVRAVGDLVSAIHLLHRRVGHRLRVWVLPTKVDRRLRLANDFLAALERHFGAALLDPVHLDANVARAPMVYEPVTRSFPGSRAARDYERVAAFLARPDAERDAGVPPADPDAGPEDDAPPAAARA